MCEDPPGTTRRFSLATPRDLCVLRTSPSLGYFLDCEAAYSSSWQQALWCSPDPPPEGDKSPAKVGRPCRPPRLPASCGRGHMSIIRANGPKRQRMSVPARCKVFTQGNPLGK